MIPLREARPKKFTVSFPSLPCQTTSTQVKKRKRVAAYCRVSSGSDEQLISYRAQVSHYQQFIGAKPDYEMAGIFADEGLSGTDQRKREAFNQMLAAARDGRIDLIITKSLSRFGRNTLDCLKNIRELRTLGVDVFFERENIHTLHSQGELLLTLVSAIAQNESFNQSENVKWGIHRKYERGQVQSIPAGKFLGYKKNNHGYLAINDDQAHTVRRIYQLFLDGFGICQIATRLTREKVTMAYGGKEWSPSHIQRVLINEKYLGDTKFQKTYNADYLTKRRVKNRGELPQYYLADTHPAIIDRETWSWVQSEIARQKQFVLTHRMDKFHHHSAEIPLSGKIICGECGRTFLLRGSTRLKNKKHWRCFSTLRTHKSCSNQKKLDETIASQAVVTAWNQLVHREMAWEPSGFEYSSLTRYRQIRLLELLCEHGVVEVMPYELVLKVLDHIEVHPDFLNVFFLSGQVVRIDLPAPAKQQPRWTHTRKVKSPMAQRRMELGLTQSQLAEKVQTARIYLNRVENGHAMPSPALMARLTEVLGVFAKDS